MTFAYLASLFLLLNITVLPSVQGEGSTPRIKEIVVGPNSTTWKNCRLIWDTSHGAFAYKDPCKLTFDDYKPYFDEVGMAKIYNKSLFWSGTYKAVHSYSEFDLRFTTLEHTMAGFARHARGIVRVMVNGSRVSREGKHISAYNRSSYFGTFELPSFKVEEITELVIIVIHTIDGTAYEWCGTHSIKLLKDDARNRGIHVSCHDDPDDVRHILCADYPLSRECRFLENVGYRNRTINPYKCRNPGGLATSVKSSLYLIFASIMVAVLNAGKFK